MQLGEHPVKADQVKPRAWDQGGQALHELLGVHDDVGRAVAVRACKQREAARKRDAAESSV